MWQSDLSASSFLERYWQRNSLYVPQADVANSTLVTGDELAGLACEEDVMSRIVRGDARTSELRCEHGPFDETRFAALQGPWTLLVQGVDQWLAQVRDVLTHFSFLPAWRLDDIMVSYASDGGGVGAHFDYYDVFLLQLSGTRNWQLGAMCDPSTATIDVDGMRLLGNFAPASEVLARAGDLLYVPARMAHRGVAVGDNCMTMSVGFRAPSYADLLRGLVHEIADGVPEQERYCDGALAPAADRFLIDNIALDRAAAALSHLDQESLRGALTLAFGKQVTEPRAEPGLSLQDNEPGDNEPEDNEQVTARATDVPAVVRLRHAPNTRWAYAAGDTDDGAILFIDGEAYVTTRQFATSLCREAVEESLLACPEHIRLLQELLACGVIAYR